MTAKEKAQELINKYLPEVRGADRYNYNLEEMNFSIAKSCALIAVTEICDALLEYDNRNHTYELQGMDSDFRFWYKVEEEIKQLTFIPGE